MDKIRVPYIVAGIFDNGACYTKKRVVLMAYDEPEARAFARRRLERHSDDCFKIDLVRKMTEEDIIVEDV